MGGTLNLSTLVVTPSMTAGDVRVVDNAHLMISEHGELAPHVGAGGWDSHSNRNGLKASWRL
jgi:hypothetical protein